jgi:hypothetical protein
MVGAPLMEIEESWMFGMFPTRLLIFEDRFEVRGFELLRETVESKGYDRVEGVMVSGEGWLANLVISEKEGRPTLIRGVTRDDAERAGALIRERAARAGGSPARATPPAATEQEGLIRSLEKLRDAGILSEEEFEAKRKGVTRDGKTYPSGGP